MSAESCPLENNAESAESDVIDRLLAAQRIAIVGLSDDPSRPSHAIAEYLISAGKEIVPINPNHSQILGLKCYARLADAPGPIDLVNVFRRSDACADIAREAIAVGASGVWLQSGVRNEEARKAAAAAGIGFVQNRCIMVEHASRPHER